MKSDMDIHLLHTLLHFERDTPLLPSRPTFLLRAPLLQDVHPSGRLRRLHLISISAWHNGPSLFEPIFRPPDLSRLGYVRSNKLRIYPDPSHCTSPGLQRLLLPWVDVVQNTDILVPETHMCLTVA